MIGLRFYRFLLLGFVALAVASLAFLFLPSLLKEPPELPIRVIRPPHEVSALAVQGQYLWAGGQEGIYKIDMNSCRCEKVSLAGQEVLDVKALLFDPYGVLWIGSFNGLYSYDGNHLKKIKALPDDRVNCLFLDKANRLWVGTWKGAVVLDPSGWRIYEKKDGLASDMVNVIIQDSRGWMWFGSYAVRKGGVTCWDGQKWHVFRFPEYLPNANVCDILEDSQGRVWVAIGFVDKGGAVCFEAKNDRPVLSQVWTVRDGLAGEKVRSLFLDSKKRLWFGSEYDGIAVYDGNSFTVITREDGLSGNEVKDMYEDLHGNFWMATEDGITKISKGGI